MLPRWLFARKYLGLLWVLIFVVSFYIILVNKTVIVPWKYTTSSTKGQRFDGLCQKDCGNSVGDTNVQIRNQRKSTSCVKNVLIWWKTDLARINYGYGGTEGLITCPNLDCSVNITYAENYSMLDHSDVVIFHTGYYTDPAKYGLFQSRRFPAQIWIWQTWESQSRVLHFMKKPPLWFHFNLTMSFSPDTDIPVPYGSYVPFERPKQLPSNATKTDWSQGKTKLIAWVAKNCQSTTWARYKFVKHLQTRLPVDIYGRCGNLSCPGWNVPCEAMKNYKFLLALENSECRDYITEKFWWWPFSDLNIVPIVFGPSKKDYQKVAPPNSFIHISDFNTLDQFVKYINLLDNNKDLYNKFFEWKQMGHVVKHFDYFSPSRICSIFHVQPPKHPHNIHNEWWKGTCKERRNWHPFINDKKMKSVRV